MSYLTEEEVVEAVSSLDEDTFIWRYLNYAVERTEAHASFHLAAALTLLAQAAPPDLGCPHFGSELHTNLYTLIIAPSSEGCKTTSIKIARRLLEKSSQRTSSTSDRFFDREIIATPPGSAEALVDYFNSRPGADPRKVLFYEEFGDLLQASGGSAETNSFAKVRMAMTNLYDGNPVGRSTVKKPTKMLPNPRLSIFGGINRGLLEDYTTTTDWTGGFMARFLTFYIHDDFYRSPDVRKMAIPPPDEVAHDFVVGKFLERVRWGYKPKPVMMQGRNSNRAGWGPCLGIGPQALELWQAYEEERRVKAQQANPLVAAGFRRADGFVIKIALLLGLDRGRLASHEPWYIDAEEMLPAIEITRLHFKGLQELGDSITFTSKDMKDRRNVLRVIADAGPEGVTKGTISEKTQLLLGSRFDSILMTLMAQKYIASGGVVENETRYVYTGREE